MIRHVMADGTKRDSIDGYIIPKDISKTLLAMLGYTKEKKNGNSNKTRVIREK